MRLLKISIIDIDNEDQTNREAHKQFTEHEITTMPYSIKYDLVDSLWVELGEKIDNMKAFEKQSADPKP